MYLESISELRYESESFISKQKYMDMIKKQKYGNSCWDILEHLKQDDQILRILAW